MPEVRSISLPANRQFGAEGPGNTKKRLWLGEVRRCLLRPLHRLARRERQDAANVPCEVNVQCRDGSLTLRAGAKIAERRQESNWLPASGQFSLYIRVYWAGVSSVRQAPSDI
ncbi:DUF1214 domain-containing protein [Bradyrhizobium sp. Arg816]|uniref:DUF1214 domain-containing protein n=1 Tax=Bradyrhizobium sp. Arg816 TaxID=2998491 RepID=UPI00249E1AE5|nr:DUF1214 domain-containing protein [Bradyrhizobium sp. Arg816]MDI3560260.1 DUF1214 domain-containing protein [Bradyrhizobium sp. Arg816]